MSTINDFILIWCNNSFYETRVCSAVRDISGVVVSILIMGIILATDTHIYRTVWTYLSLVL